ncbi:MAG: hypothetical protein INR65_18005 [Gluconacetobacter diazotrophicus]|nr:hypothetical protein [Gluconacetobacter diazotrophicus]
MSFDHLPEISGRLLVLPFEDRVEDGFGLIRTDTSPAIEVAIVHDGSDRGIGEAEKYAQLLGLSPVMLTLLQEALGAWAEQFDAPDDDHYVSGTDLLEWFGDWRLRVREGLAAPPPST